MAQGGNLNKLKKATKSAGAQRRKTGKHMTQAKGRVQKNARRTHAVRDARPQTQISKEINRKNEKIVAAKAVASGQNFRLTDLAEKGKKEHKSQLKARDKKQDTSTKLTGRLKDQIKKLKEGTRTRCWLLYSVYGCSKQVPQCSILVQK